MSSSTRAEVFGSAVMPLLGTTGMTAYLGLRDALAEDAITSDPVFIALTEGIKEPFTGTSAELLAKITPAVEDGKKGRAPDGWPLTLAAWRKR